MRQRRRAGKWFAAAASAVLMLVPGQALADAPPRQAATYLNLHQCAFYSASATNYLTTVVPSRDGRFAAGTKVSNTPETAVSCGAGDGNYSVVPQQSAVRALDLLMGRYLNLHQCVYFSSTVNDHYTTVLSGRDARFATGTKVSNTAETAVSCGPGDGDYKLVPLLSAVKALDLTAGRYVNLHQCMYFWDSTVNHITTVVPSPDGRFNTGTKVSNTAETAPTCAAGDGRYKSVPTLSGVKALDLA